MPSSSDGKARARVQSVDSGVESVVVPVARISQGDRDAEAAPAADA